MEEHNADSDDRRVLEERRDRRIMELAAQAKAAQKAEAAAKAEAARQAKAAAEAEAARQKAEDQRRRMLADADAAIAAKRYEQAATLAGNYRAAGGDAKIADQMMNRIAGQRNADIEAASRLLIADLEDVLRGALGAANTSDIKTEMAKITAIPKRIKQLGADSLKVSSAAAGALNRVGPLLVLARQGDSLKAAWDPISGLLTRALSASGASKEELRKYAADRSRLSLNANAWNKKVTQEGAKLPELSFDAPRMSRTLRIILNSTRKPRP
jgi:hypothetical protein